MTFSKKTITIQLSKSFEFRITVEHKSNSLQPLGRLSFSVTVQYLYFHCLLEVEGNVNGLISRAGSLDGTCDISQCDMRLLRP